jgi:hypothetical protein
MKEHSSENPSPGDLGSASITPEIEESIRRDAATVSRLGLTNNDIADAMSALRTDGAPGLGAPVNVAPHFIVEVDSIRGKLPCPCGHEGLFPKTNTTVTNTSTGRQISFSDLHIHMIQAHGFYDLSRSPFRIEPWELAAVLELRNAKE